MQAALFAQAHAHLPYIDTVTVLQPLSAAKVLTTAWVPGASPGALLRALEKHPAGSPECESARARLTHMMALGVECSLCQLLETGVMHADPHPGNLILTHDGRLAYLDFGLLSFVPPKASEVRTRRLRVLQFKVKLHVSN